MSVVSVQPKDFILALFIRDDGERFLLGDNGYDFMDSQLHFSANTIENDEVEKQGADGTMLAGQVRRASVQTFDGYVGDATTPKEEIEQMRRAFIAFFLKGHHYRVVYVDCARNAWQRKGGYLVDAPEVKELFQVHPEYHVGLNFEDVNYYSYDENAEGDEITANLVQVAISSAVEGGLVWDEDGAVSEDATVEYITETAQTSGKNISISDAVSAPINAIEIDGETSQQTYSGKNLLNLGPKSDGGVSGAIANGSTITVTGTALATDGKSVAELQTTLPAGTYTLTIDHAATHVINFTVNTSNGNVAFRLSAGETSITKTLASASTGGNVFWAITQGQTYNETFKLQLVSGSTPDYDYEPYVGGTASPNPTYPQAVRTVTGENTLTISDGQGNDHSYVINLGKNLFDKDNASTIGAYIAGGTSTIVTDGSNTSIYIPCQPNTTYTISKTADNVFRAGTTSVVPANGATVKNMTDNASGTKITLTSASDARYLVVFIRNNASSHTAAELMATIQIEKGSQATSYAAYFEPIELCKIGTYQDSIYKSGGKWYMRKECGKLVVNGSETGWIISASTGSPNYYYARTNAKDGISVSKYAENYCNNLINRGTYIQGSDVVNTDVFSLGSPSYSLRMLILGSRLSAMTTAALSTWLAANTPTIYYANATPTDTEITNATLIAQLEAILNGGTHAGTNNIALIPSGNEQGSLEITYYTKYVVNITAGGYEWEQGGSGGPTIVMNESIDNVYPIWTITGPITNPVLENTTTGEQIEYVGTIGEGQKLIIDMGAQTALLDGLNVISNVAGEFISLAPGANTLLYSVSNGDTASEIGWSEIVG